MSTDVLGWPRRIPLSALSFALSPRTGGVDPEHVRALARAADVLPPIVVHRKTMAVLDGVHRVHAMLSLGAEDILGRFHDGAEDEAFILAVAINNHDGRPLSRAECVEAAEWIIVRHPEWSNRAIARAAGVSDKTAGTLRERTSAAGTAFRVGRDGVYRRLNPEEGRRRAGELLRAQPDASVREIARAAGIALSTARDVRERVRRGEDPTLTRRPAASTGTEGFTDPLSPEPMGVGWRGQELLRTLRRDPSVRLSENGRRILRVLDRTANLPASWQQIDDGVPLHSGLAVAAVARDCAAGWARLAERLESRANVADGTLQ